MKILFLFCLFFALEVLGGCKKEINPITPSNMTLAQDSLNQGGTIVSMTTTNNCNIDSIPSSMKEFVYPLSMDNTWTYDLSGNYEGRLALGTEKHTVSSVENLNCKRRYTIFVVRTMNISSLNIQAYDTIIVTNTSYEIKRYGTGYYDSVKRLIDSQFWKDTVSGRQYQGIFVHKIGLINFYYSNGSAGRLSVINGKLREYKFN